jgi:hypothetical protein
VRIPRLAFDPVGAAGPYPLWVRELRGYSGSYVIAEQQRGGGNAPVVYVGESHTNRLYETLTRHFQQWKRSKRGLLRLPYNGGGGEVPGFIYDRARCLVAVVLTPPGAAAVDMQGTLIAALHPRDNVIGQVEDLEPVPF